MKYVVSVSLGAKSRDMQRDFTLLGQKISVERRGVNGSLSAAKALIRELDGQVDAIGLGGIDRYMPVGKRFYVLKDAERLAACAQVTPVVCGAGLKGTLERQIITQLSARLAWPNQRVLMVSSVDRYGMAETLVEHGAKVVFGDLAFSLGVPVPLHRLSQVQTLAAAFLPVLTRVPFTWLYPTGDKQEVRTPRFRTFFTEADVIAGDWHYIRRFMPEHLPGRIILTNTTTPEDCAFLKAAGVRTLITTSPRLEGRSLAMNMLEAALVAVADAYPLSAARYQTLIETIGFSPTWTDL